MVQKHGSIEPRSSGSTTFPNPDNPEGDFYNPRQDRTVYTFYNDLDVYAEVSMVSTHSADMEFNESLINEQGVPILPGKTREVVHTDADELLRFEVRTPDAPSSGDLSLVSEADQNGRPLDSARLNDFKELNEGRAYAVDFYEELPDGATLTAGFRLPEGADISLFIRQFGVSVGGDAIVTTEIDHGSYTDGAALPVINKKPELQVERPIDASVTQNPTISSPQETMKAFFPGGTAGNTAPGNRFPQADFELSPGQDMTVTIKNDSGSSDKFGFSLELIETVVR